MILLRISFSFIFFIQASVAGTFRVSEERQRATSYQPETNFERGPQQRAKLLGHVRELLDANEKDWESIAREIKRVQNGGTEAELEALALKILSCDRPAELSDGQFFALRSSLYILGVSETDESLIELLKYTEAEAWGATFKSRIFNSADETVSWLTGAAIEQIGRKPPDVAIPILRLFEKRHPNPAPDDVKDYQGMAVQWGLRKATLRAEGKPYDDKSMLELKD